MDSSPETKSLLEKQELGFHALLKESFRIPVRNIRFTCFILLSSIPLLLLMVFFEYLLEKTLQESLKLERTYVSASEYWFVPYYHVYTGLENLGKIFSGNIILVTLLTSIYLVPLPFLEFVAAYSTIYFASKAYKNNPRKKDRLKHLRGFFVTSLIVMFLSTALFMGFIWLSIAIYSYNMISLYDITVMVIYLAGLVIAMPKYLEASVIGNLGLVVSVIGDIHGIDALAVSMMFSKGKEKLGCYLMMVFFVWGFSLRVPCLFFDDGKVGIIVRTILLWLGSLFKWVVCVVYCYECMGEFLDRRMAGNSGATDEESLRPNAE